MSFRKLFLGTGLLITALSGALLSSAQTVTINLSEELQEIRGFGGMSHTTWIRDLNEDNREKAFGNDPGEIGLSILRIHIDPAANNFNLEVPTALHAYKNGAQVFATPWNAPDAVLDKSSTQSKVDPTKYGEYVAHLNSFNTFMENNGVPLYAISVQNEPDYGEWTRWTSAEMVNFLSNYGQDIQNRVMAPESFQFRRDYTDPILNNEKAAENVDIIGGHIYGGGLSDYALARAKGKDVWMTEHLLGSDANDINDWNLALVVAKEINDCMKANFNAYIWWYIRRFYCLITEDGNISDKGYVMSQYSKFVRPGAVRVKVDDSKVSMTDVTAYKTDTSLVFVVVNRDSKNKEVVFNLEGSNIEKLTKFTSSSTKKLENEGDITISEGTFGSVIDAKSVTTFTSYSRNGGRHGNQKPTSNAGEDIIIKDSLGTGVVSVKLDGSLSSDSDGEIVYYSWSRNGEQVSSEPTLDLSVLIGEFDVVLTVTDNDGATDSDTIHLSMESTNSTEIWLEAECGTIGKTWKKLTDNTASNKSYIVTTDGKESTGSASTNADDIAEYEFTTSERGKYKIWGRVITPSANDDSYWVKVDTSDWVMWNSIPSGTSWHWDDVHNQSGDNTVYYELEPGDHVLSICIREDGAKLDKILIANTGITPTEVGSEADNCEPVTNSACILKDDIESVEVYPNPTSGRVKVIWKEKFNYLKVYNSTGKMVIYKEYSEEINMSDEIIDQGKGIYLMVIGNDKKYTVKKLMVE